MPVMPAFINKIPPAVRLTAIGCSMAAIWFFAFGGRYSLAQYGQLPMQSLATLNHNSLDSALVYVVSFAALFLLYWLAVRTIKAVSHEKWIILIGCATLMNAALLPMHPFDAADVYDYIIRGRMTTLYGLNPMKDIPSQVPASDSVLKFAGWPDSTSAYGPAWEAVAALTVRLAGDDRNTDVIAFKLLAILSFGITALFLGLTLESIAPNRTYLGVLLFAWNPLMSLFAGGTGHNDLLMSTCVAIGIYFFCQKRFTFASLAIVLGGLIKFVPLLFLPIIAIWVWKNQPLRLRLRTYATTIGLSLILVLAFYAPFWTGFSDLAIDRRAHMFTSSVGTLAREALVPFLGSDDAGTVVNFIAVFAFGVFYLWQLLILIRSQKNDPLYYVQIMLRVLLFYLMVSATWFQHWYLAWVIPLAALLEDTPARQLTLLFSYLVTWQPLLYNYVTLRYDGWMPLPWRDLIPVSVFMGGAWLYVIIYLLGVRHRSSRLSDM